jgi:hypothetical protein
VAKSDLGTKRICPTTGKKFYDLNKNPVISPYTGEVVPIEDDDDDDSTFIADEEEGDEDVTDIIGDVGGDEET